MKLLAIETSSAQGSIALGVDDRLQERTIPTPREQTELVLPLIGELLTSAGLELAELDAIVFGRGPGSFTGLRVAATVAQGLSLASGRPIVAVSSLAALAQRVHASHAVPSVLACIDARMREVYWGLYRFSAGLAILDGVEEIGAADRVPVPAGPAWAAAGSGFAEHAQALAEHRRRAEAVLPDLMPRASDLLALGRDAAIGGRFVTPEAAVPVYLRNADAWRR